MYNLIHDEINKLRLEIGDKIELKILELMETFNLNQEDATRRFDIVWLSNPCTCKSEPYMRDMLTGQDHKIL